ncbi:KdsC family phosphatase [Desulfovibrio sp. TomC]|uniref:KdsC family phosphatase n=1 Tax=Desulfovibrio sp. TomC TaxID=1562888 RepID=UPI000575694F|nr:3-deoxy-D-manno-octulosonate 8-phosphate phosphatase [Desulfovibrio sp. TomC]KHK04508.1 3-deoxy-D-manno-octulosonate 8-phosphate phosphatase [Desulfovibrio sp. TomC]
MPEDANLAASRAREVALLVLDVDGVMTDGGIYVDARGEVTKRFHVHDSLGLMAAQAVGLAVAVISGLDSPAVAARMADLGIAEYHPGHHRKMGVLRGILERQGVSPEQTAYLGDDWVDAGPMGLVGLPMTVADAQPEILELALWVSRRGGGHGAVREAVRFILAAKGQLGAAYEWFLD